MTMANLLTTKYNSVEFKQLINKTSTTNNINISNFLIENFSYLNENIENINFKDTEWNNIDAHGSHMKNITFNDCTLSDINFRNTKLENVSFTNCKLINVVLNESTIDNITFTKSKIINTDTNINNNHIKITAKTISFIDSELYGLDFYRSKAHFIFDSSILKDVSSYGLMPGSNLTIKNSNVSDVDFSNSNLDSLLITGSTIKESKINDADIKTIIIEDNSFERFSIASNKKYGSVKVSNTSEITVHGTGPVTDVLISGCPSYKDIYISEMNFINAKIENCKIPKLTAFDIIGSKLTLSNMEVFSLDLEDAKIDQLILDNVVIRGKIYAKNATVNKYEAHNVTVLDNVAYENNGSNFKITNTK